MNRIFVPTRENFHVTDDAPLGGAVVFSTDVNTVRLHHIKMLNLVLQRMRTFWQRMFMMKKITHIISWMNENHDEQISNLTIHHQRGIYLSPSGQRYKEKSVRLELAGCSRMLLTETAKIVLQHFCQQSVMVICYDEGVKFHIHV